MSFGFNIHTLVFEQDQFQSETEHNYYKVFRTNDIISPHYEYIMTSKFNGEFFFLYKSN